MSLRARGYDNGKMKAGDVNRVTWRTRAKGAGNVEMGTSGISFYGSRSRVVDDDV